MFRMKLEQSRSLLQGHWCSNNILFTNCNNLKQKVCFNFSSVFEFSSILFFLSLWVRGGDRPQCPALETASGQWLQLTSNLSIRSWMELSDAPESMAACCVSDTWNTDNNFCRKSFHNSSNSAVSCSCCNSICLQINKCMPSNVQCSSSTRYEQYRVRQNKIMQHEICYISEMPEYFCTKFCLFVWHNTVH